MDFSTGAEPPFIAFQLKIKTFIDSNLDNKDFYYGSGGSAFNACKFTVDQYLLLGAEVQNLTADSK